MHNNSSFAAIILRDAFGIRSGFLRSIVPNFPVDSKT